MTFLALATHSAAQQSFQDYFPTGSNESSIVLIVDADVKSVTLNDGEGKTLDFAKWGNWKSFVRHYRVPPGTYNLHLDGPLDSLTATVKPGSSLTIRLSPFGPKFGSSKIDISAWTQGLPEDITYIIKDLQSKGLSQFLSSGPVQTPDKNLYLKIDTDPPWNIPPPPKR
jgi:hypothetical protein